MYSEEIFIIQEVYYGPFPFRESKRLVQNFVIHALYISIIVWRKSCEHLSKKGTYSERKKGEEERQK